MAKKLGSDYRLWIESSTAGTYNEIKGQVKLKVSRSANQIDSTSKDSGGYETGFSGTKKVTIDVEMNPDLPDATGYTRFASQFATGATTNFQIRKGGSSGGAPDVVFQSLMNIASLDEQEDMNTVIAATAQLTLAAAPTTDTLA